MKKKKKRKVRVHDHVPIRRIIMSPSIKIVFSENFFLQKLKRSSSVGPRTSIARTVKSPVRKH